MKITRVDQQKFNKKKVKVYINGKKKTTIANNETIDLELVDPSAKIHFS